MREDAGSRTVAVSKICLESIEKEAGEEDSATLHRRVKSRTCDASKPCKKREQCPVPHCKEVLTFSNQNTCKARPTSGPITEKRSKPGLDLVANVQSVNVTTCAQSTLSSRMQPLSTTQLAAAHESDALSLPARFHSVADAARNQKLTPTVTTYTATFSRALPAQRNSNPPPFFSPTYPATDRRFLEFTGVPEWTESAGRQRIPGELASSAGISTTPRCALSDLTHL
ncbi:Zinc finger AN1 domain-containing stress-associated protein 17 [Platanthera zijinensis]|uniref:Zinc finger AN1 domain-containing stress-associated protein 17 n=1 Tax=Platanthera zijinensis TaxID=2320716 RepID=A0AAP0G264_9ASPA